MKWIIIGKCRVTQATSSMQDEFEIVNYKSFPIFINLNLLPAVFYKRLLLNGKFNDVKVFLFKKIISNTYIVPTVKNN